MTAKFARFEQSVFRALNAVVEPAVRAGIGSPALAPACLIVLETVGFKSGEQRRTPLWSVRFGRYRIVSTARGRRSFWLKNLLQEPRAGYYVGGRRRESDAIVIADGVIDPHWATRTLAVRRLATVLAKCAGNSWAFAVLVPIKRL